MTIGVDEIARVLAGTGLVMRGGFTLDAEDDLTAPSGRKALSLVLIGNTGASHWEPFRNWVASRADADPHPLDRWTRAVIKPAAARLGARALFPFDRPYPPFQQWAMRAEGLRSSPLGILMHPEYGLWHAYRAALLFEDDVLIQMARGQSHPCDLCDGKPCLKSCPVGAHSESGFAYKSCLAHVRSDAGSGCRDDGCFDRNACPVGAQHRYPAETQAFHMAAFSSASAS